MATDTLTLPQPSAVTDPAGKSAPKIHLGYLDSLRALAALHVVIVHGLDQVDRNGLHSPTFVHWFRAHCSYGHHAVGLFIVLSGFCLMMPVVKGDGTLRGGTWNFYKKRARRILPTYYLALAVCLLLIVTVLNKKTGSFWDFTFPVTVKSLAAHLLMVQDTSAKTAFGIDYPLWSVSVEWRIYFLFPLLVLGWQRFGAMKTTLAAVAAGYVALMVLRPTFVFTYTNGSSPEYLGLFAMGMLGAGITFSHGESFARLRRRMPWGWTALATTVLLLLLSNIKPYHGSVIPISMLDFFVGLWAMSLLIAAGYKSETPLHRALSWKPLAFLGTFAYSIYVIHAPVLQLIWLYIVRPLRLTPTLGFFSIFVIFIPLVVALAYIFFLACERPFLNRRVVLNTN